MAELGGGGGQCPLFSQILTELGAKQIQLEGYIDKYRIAMNASPSCFEAHVGLSDCL